MTPKKRVEKILRGEAADKIPFTIYDLKLPRCSVERKLRNDGLCIVKKVSVVKRHTPNIKGKSYSYVENGIKYTSHITETSAGELSCTTRVIATTSTNGYTTWTESRIFKGPEDYKKLMLLIKDEHFEPDYEPFARSEKMLGDDVIMRAEIGANPLHLIMVSWMGIETFSIEWAERRDEIEKLYHAMVENLRKIFPIAAKSPTLHGNFGGNETGNVMGRERFEKYAVPILNEAAEVFHKHGKYIGTHLDGNNKVWADLVAKCGLDYIEAFSPSPDSDMTLSEAFSCWPGKLLWINFPSSLQLSAIPAIEKATGQLIREAMPDHRLIIGITEDIPRDRWQENLLAISGVINGKKFS